VNSNHGDFNRWRGGAIKTETGTSLTISSCNFESNEAAGGGAIYHRGDMLVVSDSSFANNSAKEGGAIMVDSSAGTEIFDSVFINNFATITDGGAIQLMGSEVFTYDSLTGSGNSPCIGVYDRSNGSCLPLGLEPDKSAFVLGELTVSAFGLRLSTGLSVKIIARADQRVPLTSPERSGSMSKLKYHTNPDGAAVFPLNDGGWIYMSNAENVDGNGGVFGVVFDSNGRIKDYVTRLTGTTRNCSGGSTPWNTWVSCEEHGRGQCWQVDPTGARSPAKTKLVEQRGGNFEAMAYDISDLNQPYFFVTEDHERGALRRFKPVCDSVGLSWNLIQLNGEIEYLQFNDDNTFQWTPSIDAGRDSAQQYYQYSEGISFDDGILSFVSKRQKEIFHLDLDAGTYTVGSTDRGRLSGGGSFSAGPDQIIQYGDLLYFTEDGGGNPGIYASDGTDYYTLFEARDSKFRGDETTGLAFSPDGTKLYVCIQEIGFMFEITRDDGLPFPGGRKVSQLRWHNKEPEE
jgi:predicted outer membrane repeat protein